MMLRVNAQEWQYVEIRLNMSDKNARWFIRKEHFK